MRAVLDRITPRAGLAAALVVLASCDAPPPELDEARPVEPGAEEPGVVVVQELFETPRDSLDNIDSPAVWHGPDGQDWLLTTAKEGDAIVVYDAGTGERLHRVGTEGAATGQLDRPNGIVVIDDLALIVERDNARVQAFSLPDFGPLGTFGEAELRLPYGIAVVPSDAGGYFAYVTDNYELEEDEIPPDDLLAERVRQYRIQNDGERVSAELVRTFGDTEGPGVLRVVESIAADAANDRLLIAEEQEGASMIKAYTLDGRFTGQVIESSYFPSEAEGLALYECGDTDGYWVTTDQSSTANTFHVFDRVSLGHLGSFRGPVVSNTDGIALTQAAFGPFPAGAVYAVNNDQSVVAFSWREIADSLGLRSDCVR